MPEQFLNTTKKVSKNKIDLKLFYSFYRDYICPYRYIYTLETGEIIEIKFEKNNFPHLLGLHKFKKVAAIDKAEEILAGIFEETITTKILKETDNTVFNVTADRLTYFPTLQTILDTSKTLIKFDPTKCIPTKVEADFFIYSEEIKVIVFLAIREINSKDNKIICCPVSFMVDRTDKFQKNKQKHIQIKTLKKESGID
ncbi:PBECR4 domain-containing protein [Candidatus Cetobacterium colombiensis]|uniref:PBECR4 domain-containing protein n=1 Tax=Candidatus Cetobacterium colombiensis TaxID=3073100 RepID=A0ABU4WDX8_9FUSO|nr:PBECR4 domain-containing protein [Candidatus Cetobacterium colombiensis]MDX8337222.1 PBECR4 domain-containing protein [Candidatus Cetobacterium colombiensis]